jgi:hypothetical protein
VPTDFARRPPDTSVGWYIVFLLRLKLKVVVYRWRNFLACLPLKKAQSDISSDDGWRVVAQRSPTEHYRVRNCRHYLANDRGSFHVPTQSPRLPKNSENCRAIDYKLLFLDRRSGGNFYFLDCNNVVSCPSMQQKLDALYPVTGQP